ncbi:DUF2480 family protein [Flavobacteriaceae bacterium]|nr:DUF2480 family protein [Flavobacteriaceae bacterium]
MEEEIVNRVAKSPLITFDLEDFYPEGERRSIDMSQWLEQGLILREKDFRIALKNVDFKAYENTYVAINCSTEALLPAWASLLVTTHIQPFAKKVVLGSLQDLERQIFEEIISQLDTTPFVNKPVIIKGCSEKNIPAAAFVSLIQKLQPHAKSLFYGEACSSVPLHKK